MASVDAELENIRSSFLELTSKANSLNKASDELTRVVGVLDTALKKINLGVTTWVTFRRWSDEEGEEWGSDQIGYAKVNGKWGIALLKEWNNYRGEEHYDGPWLFGESPRDLRLRAVDHLPKLIHALVKEAQETTETVKEKTRDVTALIGKIVKDTEPAERTK